MEVTRHRDQEETWEDLYRLTDLIYRGWLSGEQLEKAEAIAEAHGAAAGRHDPEARRERDRLEGEHLTEAQIEYGRRAYPRAEGRPPGAWPWPVPDRVPTEERRALLSIVEEEPPTSPTAWAALRALGVAAAIEAANLSEEVAEDGST